MIIHLAIEYIEKNATSRVYAMGKLKRKIGKNKAVPGLELPKDAYMAQWEDSDKTIRHVAHPVQMGEDPSDLTYVHRLDALVEVL